MKVDQCVSIDNLDSVALKGSIDSIVAETLTQARIPGAAVAVVAHGRTVFAEGYGVRSLVEGEHLTARTVYPIASTSKAINATLIATLVEEGRLSWKVPIREYLPSVKFYDPVATCCATLGDLICMRTGLPRHDWAWWGLKSGRSLLVHRMRHLQPATGFREAFQYNNLTHMLAGFVAEIVTGEAWENLVSERIFQPLGMGSTTFGLPKHEDVTRSYHEGPDRTLIETERLASEVIAPAGGSIHSNVEDMARWAAFSLDTLGQSKPVSQETLRHLHTPVVTIGDDPAAPTPGSQYAMGWFVDRFHGLRRVSHGGYLHDVHSNVMLLPDIGLGLAGFINFGPPRVARLMLEQISEAILDLPQLCTLAEKLGSYEKELAESIAAIAARSASRPAKIRPPSADVAGTYHHPGYGGLIVRQDKDRLRLLRRDLELGLEHWSGDVWAFPPSDKFEIYDENPFGGGKKISFTRGFDDRIDALLIKLEPKLDALRFSRTEQADNAGNPLAGEAT